MDIAQGRDLAPLFGDLGQREKRFEIELPLAAAAAAAAAEFAFEKLTLTTSSISHSAVFKTISLH